MYAKRIDLARKIVAVLFGLCGLGLVLCVNLHCGLGAEIFGTGVLASLAASVGLFVEYLVRSRVEARKDGTTAYQFTLAELLIATTALAVVLSLYRIIGAGAIGVVVAVTVLSACGLEIARRKKSEPQRRKERGR